MSNNNSDYQAVAPSAATGSEEQYKGMLANGFLMLGVVLLLIVGAIVLVSTGSMDQEAGTGSEALNMAEIIAGVIFFILAAVSCSGFFSQQPNQSRVMIFFGKYKGTFRGTGFFWCNPFMNRVKMSLRIHNMDIEPIKVNDKTGNPVMIGMVLVWRVSDTYRAVFDVDAASTLGASQGSGHEKALNSFVRIQGDAALREVTGHYAYDTLDGTSDEITLRSGGDEINELLERKINDRLAMAGIEVVEARINYLAYAPEIAAVMLRRQQAAAIISAREKIVEGAVSMVRMALDELKEQGVVELDEERKAAMVSNLLVVLCADEPAQPVVSTGTLTR